MCDDDRDYPDFCGEHRRKAAKKYSCCACGENILKGDYYIYISGCWDGEFSSFKQCLRCNAMMEGIIKITGENALITLNCGEEFQPGEAPTLEHLAFVTREEMQVRGVIKNP